MYVLEASNTKENVLCANTLSNKAILILIDAALFKDPFIRLDGNSEIEKSKFPPLSWMPRM